MSIFKELGIREGRDRLNEEVLYNIAAAYLTIDRVLSGFLAPHDLSLAKFNILMMVKHVGLEKGLSQHALSKLLLVTTSNMTRMIDKLEKEGHVRRVAQDGDRRVHLIQITRQGSSLLDTLWPAYKAQVDSLVDAIYKPTDKKALNTLLEKFSTKKRP